MIRKNTAIIGAVLASSLLLTGCSSTGSSSTDSTSASAEATTVQFADAWVKAGDIDGMSGVFGTLSNTGKTDLTITSVESSIAGMAELHEVTADGVMQKIKGDVVIPAGGSYELAPGANHIMLMDLTQPLLAGDDTTVTVHFDDGSSSEFTVTVKDYTGAKEEYGDMDHGEMDHGEMDHGEMDHGEMDHGGGQGTQGSSDH